MNSETEIPPLPEPNTSEMTATYFVPHILTESKDGVDSIRRGGARQVVFFTEIFFTETKQQEPSMPIIAQNSFRFGDATIDVLNDEGDFHGQHLMASKPSASEYLSVVGHRTTIKFDSRQMPPRASQHALHRDSVYINTRTSIVIP